jgi:hypothetical protein
LRLQATGRRGAEFQSPDLCATRRPGATAFDDGLNKTVKTSTIVSEYFFRDADAQQKIGMNYWAEAMH